MPLLKNRYFSKSLGRIDLQLLAIHKTYNLDQNAEINFSIDTVQQHSIRGRHRKSEIIQNAAHCFEIIENITNFYKHKFSKTGLGISLV